MTPEELRDRIAKAAEALKPIDAKGVYLFGSAAHGEPGKARDVDLAVEGLPPDRRRGHTLMANPHSEIRNPHS